MARDNRTETEHDCDRILYSSAYRRLAGVTQVVAVDEIQLFHNRLTHTQKVAQLTRRLAEDFVRDKDLSDTLSEIGGIDAAAAEAAALAHDIGHPPFGHIAESVLCQRCDDEGADGFEGNAQSFRIVTKLARGANDELGLSLRPKTLRAILKYPWFRGEDPGPAGTKTAQLHRKKWGAYLSEESEFNAAVPDGSEAQSPEATIMDWCDDISYALHDLEDFFRANLIPLERIGNLSDDDEALDFLGRANHELSRNPEYDPDEGKRALKRLRGWFPPSPYRGTHEDRQGLHTMTSKFIDSYFGSTTVHTSPPWIRMKTAAKHEVMLLKQLTWQYVVNGPSLATMQEGQQRVIDETFTSLMECLKKEKRQGNLHRLPAKFLLLYHDLLDDEAAKDSLPTTEARHARVVADYICSLTEEQVIKLHGRLSGRSSGSVLDGWMRW